MIIDPDARILATLDKQHYRLYWYVLLLCVWSWLFAVKSTDGTEREPLAVSQAAQRLYY